MLSVNKVDEALLPLVGQVVLHVSAERQIFVATKEVVVALVPVALVKLRFEKVF